MLRSVVCRTLAVWALLVVLVACSGGVESVVAPVVSPTVAPEPTLTPGPTAEPTVAPTLTPGPTVEPTPTPVPTAEPTPTPVPTAEPTPTPVPTAEPTPTPVPTAEPTPTVLPTSGSVDVRALRTAGGHMLTVRGTGPPYEVVTPCFNVAMASAGAPISGPVDVLIDPGHGGEETGAVAPNGLVEADLNLRVAELVREQLIDLGYRVLLTRYSDHRMAIQARTELANALEPRVFMSIHHNGGFPEPVDRPGTEMFFGVGNDEARRLAGVLFEELQAEFADEEIAWVGTEWLGVSWRVNEGGTDLYGVLRRTPGMVSVLTEAMYMTAEPEAALLADPATLQAEADALVRGLVRWFETQDLGSGYLDGLVFRGDLGPGGGTAGCVDPAIE